METRRCANITNVLHTRVPALIAPCLSARSLLKNTSLASQNGDYFNVSATVLGEEEWMIPSLGRYALHHHCRFEEHALAWPKICKPAQAALKK